MGPMLMYPLVKTVDTVELTLTHVGGQTIVSWDDIERAFPGMKRVQDGRSAIKFVGGSSQQSCSVDVVLTTSFAPTGINRPRVDRVDRHARRVNAPPEDSVLDPWEAAQSTTSTAAFRYAVAQTSRGSYENHIKQFYASLWAPEGLSSSDLYETFDKAIMVSQEEFTRADDGQETGRHLVELTNTMSSSTASQAAMPLEDSVLDPWETAQSTTSTAAFQHAVAQISRDPYEYDIKHSFAPFWAPKVLASPNLYETFVRSRAHARQETGRPLVELTNTMSSSTASQAAMSAKQETTMCPQKQTLTNQEEMKEMAVFLSRAQAILTQTYKLHEYPIPRLFVVLPQDSTTWDPVNVFANKFRLYFLCECGDYTKSINKNTKIPHHIHLAKHEGYEIARPSEFFQQYGSYVLTILKMIKYEVTVAGVAMPAFSQLISPEVLGQTIQGLKALQNTILPLVDQVINWLDNAETTEGVTCQVARKEGTERADLRKLEEFLHSSNGAKVLGNLYKIVTDKEHVKWVCMDHIRELYSQTAVNTFRHAVESVGGVFDENNGMAKVHLKSRGLAEHFYFALGDARFVHELDICLEMNITRSDLEALEHALKNVSVSILRLDLQHSRPSLWNLLSSVHARNEVLLRIMEHPRMKVVHIVFSEDFIKHSQLLSRTPPHLQKLSFGMVSDGSGVTDFRTLLRMLKTNSNLTLLHFVCSSVGESEAQALAEILKADSTLATLSLELNLLEDGGAQVMAEALTINSTLVNMDLSFNLIGDDGAQALSMAMKTNSSLVDLDLEGNLIGLNGAQALAEALKTNVTLATLNLNRNSIGPHGAQALADSIKTNSTLISLNLYDNSIGDSGALALAEALRINAFLRNLDVRYNSIEYEGGQALLEVLKTNSTLVTLNMGRTALTEKGYVVLGEAVKSNSTLASLNVEYNSLGRYGTLALADALKINLTLTTLNLGGNAIGPAGAQRLADMIKTNATLTTLNLGDNTIGDRGAQALAGALRTNATLTTLHLMDCDIGSSGAQVLAEALKINSTLVSLDLMGNSIGSNAAQVMAEALKANSSLTSLYLDYNSIDDNGAVALAGALKVNSTLTFLSLRENLIGYSGRNALYAALDIDRSLAITVDRHCPRTSQRRIQVSSQHQRDLGYEHYYSVHNVFGPAAGTHPRSHYPQV